MRILPLLGLGIGFLFLPRLLAPRSASPSASPPPDPARSQFPITLIDGVGRRVELTSPPERIVSLAPSLTEMAWTMGVGDRLIGRTRYCRWPEAARKVPVIGGLNDPEVERLLAMRPDLVLATKLTSREVVQYLAGTGLKVIVFTHAGIAGMLDDMQRLAAWVKVGPAGLDQLQDLFRRYNRLREAAARIPESRRARVLLLFGLEGYYSGGKGSFSGEIVQLAGALNLADRTGIEWPRLAMESILEWDPETIVLAEDRGESANPALREQFAAWKTDPRWGRVSAVRHQNLLIMNNAVMTIPGPRVIDAAEKIALALYPRRHVLRDD